MFDSPGPPPAGIPPLQQHAFFAAALATLGKVPLFLPGDPPLWALRRRWMGLPLAMLPRAPLDAATCADLPARLAEAGLGRHLVILSPDAPAPHLARLGAVPLMTPAHVAELGLTLRPEARLARQHGKWRNRLRHAQRQKLRIARSALPADPGHWLLTAEAAQQQDRRYRGWPPALCAAYALANKGRALLFEAREGKETIAALLILSHPPGATYQIGHTTERGRAVSAHNLLLWEAANWLARKGHRRLDLGPLDQANGAGLARFKLGAGADVRTLGGTWGWFAPLGRTLGPLARLDRAAMAAPAPGR